MSKPCPACNRADLRPLADLGEVPVAVGLTYPSEAAAMSSPRGRMTLHSCPACAHVVNVDFDPTLCGYDSSYELALFHSPTYARYADELAARLASTYALNGARVLELGGGSGEFVGRLAALGSVGFASDPAHAEVSTADGLTLLPGLVPAGTGFDSVVARFVLEHVVDPYALLTEVRALAGPTGVRAFLEVPDARYDLATAGWDCIYPHVGYFNDTSLRAVCERAGFTVLRSGRAFHDQYLWVEISSLPASPVGPVPVPVAELHEIVTSFTPRYRAAQENWVRELARQAADGAHPVLWGAGTRGMMFCNRVDDARRLAGVVDRDPGKRGRYIPITGHRVLAPDDLVGLDTRTVIVTNPAYRTEIHDQLREMGLITEVFVA